ncbi:activating transcription factor 7-interacting protein 1-like [Oncorhynchus clarkii lewisi]|uniref:activating transcription factor 7-interacting protein 1-like n=1 Tax=Oncorhynchus clarkii lewisi TaxID=490388 RepID=UPI0039B872CC
MEVDLVPGTTPDTVPILNPAASLLLSSDTAVESVSSPSLSPSYTAESDQEVRPGFLVLSEDDDVQDESDEEEKEENQRESEGKVEKVEVNLEKPEQFESGAPVDCLSPSSPKPLQIDEEEEGAALQKKRSLSGDSEDGGQKQGERDLEVVERHNKRPRVDCEELEAHVELKISGSAERQHKLKKVVQQLVEEQLCVLQLTLFDKSLQGLRDRLDKIEKHPSALKSLQAKIGRLSKKVGTAIQARENAKTPPEVPLPPTSTSATATTQAGSGILGLSPLATFPLFHSRISTHIPNLDAEHLCYPSTRPVRLPSPVIPHTAAWWRDSHPYQPNQLSANPSVRTSRHDEFHRDTHHCLPPAEDYSLHPCCSQAPLCFCPLISFRCHTHNHDYTHGLTSCHNVPHNHTHNHAQDHNNTQGHDHNNTQGHNHNHTQGHNHNHTQGHNHNHTQGHNHNHTQGHNHNYTQGHNHNHTQGHNHNHTQGHNHNHTQGHNHNHTQGHNHNHTLCHTQYLPPWSHWDSRQAQLQCVCLRLYWSTEGSDGFEGLTLAFNSGSANNSHTANSHLHFSRHTGRLQLLDLRMLFIIAPCSLPLEAASTSPPQQPLLKITRVPSQNDGIVLSWSVIEVDRSCAAVDSYHLYAYHQDHSGPSTHPLLWKKIGEVKALALPMACTLTQFVSGSKYYFAVRARDVFGRFGPFCEPQCTDVLTSPSPKTPI